MLIAIALFVSSAMAAAAQAADPALTHYLAAQAALAAGNQDAAASALAELAASTTSTTIASRARTASRETSLDAMRLAFRDISTDATQWRLPAGVAIFYCAESMDGRGAFWLQHSGAAANPYDPSSNCGSETSVGRLAQEASVVGYFDSYAQRNAYSVLRLDAPLLEIPLSVTPITRDLIDDQNALDVNDAVRATSTTTPVAGFNQRPNFYIVRGFYVFSYRDGVRMHLDGAAPINSASLQSIEVLRGPSSILYGKGEPGGLVNFTSKQPVPAFGGSADFNFGTDGLMRGDFDVTGALGKGVAGRMIVSGYTADSYRDSVASDAFYFNPSVAFRPNGNTVVTFAADYNRYHYVPDQGVLVPFGGTIPAFFTRQRYMGDPAEASTRMQSLRLTGNADIKVSADWDMRFVFGAESQDSDEQVSFQNLVDAGPTGYAGVLAPNTLLRVRYDEAPTRRYDYVRFENVYRFAQGRGSWRVAHQLLAEGDYRRDNEQFNTVARDHSVLSYVDGSTSTLLGGSIPLGQGLVYDFKSASDATQSDAAFAAQDLIAIGDRVNLLAGVRLEHNHVHTIRTGHERINPGPVVSLDSAPPDANNTTLAPRLGVVYKTTPRISLYSSYLTAFISPVPGVLTKAGDVLDAEHSRQLEGGLKTALRRDRLFFTAAVYTTVKDNAFVFYPEGYAENAGREESKGVELEVLGAVTSHLNVMGGYTYTEAEFTESSPDLKGKTRPGLPRHSFSSWVQYSAGEGQLRGLEVGAGVNAIGSVFASYPNTASLDGYASVNAMVGYGRKQWRLQMNGWNLNDALGYSPSGGFFTGSDPNIQPMSALPIPGRRITTTLSVRFR
jgi:iron complex outermembrane receptor protein